MNATVSFSAQLADAAVAWNASRLRARELRSQRAAERCEHEQQYESDTGSPAVPPCWHTYRQTAPDDVELLARSEWCEPCLRRQAIHEEYRAEMQRRGALMRRVERLARKVQPS